MVDTAELFMEIKKAYGREIFTAKELCEILLNCDYSMVEARQIIRNAFKEKHVGRVCYKQIGRNFVGGSTLVVLRQKQKKEEII